MREFVVITMVFMCLACLLPGGVSAELKVIETTGSYVMGDNDSKIDARRIAVQEAKRKALEAAGTFVESLTEIKNMALTKDEVRAYTAGVVETSIISEEMKGTAEHPEISVKTSCRIDTDVLMKQLRNFRESEELKEQLEAAQKENEALKKERDRIVRELAVEKDKTKTENIRKKLDNVLAKEESSDEVNRIWRDMAFRENPAGQKKALDRMNEKDFGRAETVLKKAVEVDPGNLRARMLLAAVYRKRGDITGAEKELRAVIAGNPSVPFPHIELGQLLKEEGRYKEALREFNRAHEARPNDARLLFSIGMTHRADGDCYGAAANLRRFLKVAEKGSVPDGMKIRAVQVIKECEGAPKKRLFDNYMHK